MGNPFCHVELMTTDLAKSKTFYKSLFNWKIEDIPNMDYSMIQVGEGVGGGMMKVPSADIPSHWMSYVLVDDIVASTKKAKDLGATICKDITEVPGMGRLSVFIDPTGAHLALWQPTKK